MQRGRPNHPEPARAGELVRHGFAAHVLQRPAGEGGRQDAGVQSGQLQVGRGTLHGHRNERGQPRTGDLLPERHLAHDAGRRGRIAPPGHCPAQRLRRQHAHIQPRRGAGGEGHGGHAVPHRRREPPVARQDREDRRHAAAGDREGAGSRHATVQRQGRKNRHLQRLRGHRGEKGRNGTAT